MNFILQEKRRSHLLRKRTTFGASPGADIRIHTKIRPTFHATIFVENRRAFIINHLRENLFINGLRTNRAFLFNGDVIEIGEKTFFFKIAKTFHIDLTNDSMDDTIDLTRDEQTEEDINNNSKTINQLA